MIRTLVVDDQALVRGGLCAMLEACDDIEVVGEAADGAEAVEQARLRRPDVVLMDIRMPRDRRDRGDPAAGRPAPDAPRVLILTTFDADEYVYEAMRAGAAGFLLKDTPPAKLADGHPHGRGRRGAARPDGHAAAGRALRPPPGGHVAAASRRSPS